MQWLEIIGFQQYKQEFKNNDIRGKHLLQITHLELTNDLKISSLGHRLDILKEISLMRDKCQNFTIGQNNVTLKRVISRGSSGVVWNCVWNNREW